MLQNVTRGVAMAYSYGDPRRYSKGAVTRAGNAVAAGKPSPEDIAIINNWRNSHAYVLNTFQATLRSYIRKGRADVTFAQRLKRLTTIVDKLRSGRAKDLASMHDLAGCRLIFSSIADLNEFRERFHTTRARHERIDANRYDYIVEPKATGYRGVHEVYKYQATTHGGAIYNNLKIELQFRTRVQHAWATAVEISDLLDGARIKFDQGVNPKRERIFALAAEIIAREKEDLVGCLPDLSDAKLRDEFRKLERELNVISTLHAARKSDVVIPARKHIVLRIHQGDLAARGFTEAKEAIVYRDAIEKDNPDDDVVYVTAQTPRAIADAFRNYFRDAADFVDLVNKAL